MVLALWLMFCKNFFFFFLFQTPFNFGMNHRTPPYPAGDYCLLCRSERKDSSFLESGVKTASKLALSMAPKGNSVLHLPLWVCPDCRRTVEKEERHGGLEQPAVSACGAVSARGAASWDWLPALRLSTSAPLASLVAHRVGFGVLCPVAGFL